METIDARGLPCPQPVVRTKKALEAAPGESLTVRVDNPESRDNVSRFARSQGCEVAVREAEGDFYLDITPQSAPAPVAEVAGGGVVLITDYRFGTGDERLGEILMKAFLNTLWDYDPKPAKLVFVNYGVRLTTEGSEVLETLSLLEKKGVEVFSCGTCLEYYGLGEKLKVGLVSNMYAIVDILLSASKVVRL
jgi:selenium metabolism protein YedF